jgi:hypothetical protein
MRVMLPLVLTACLGAGMLAGGAEQARDASSVLAAAREALGGEKALTAVKAFVATGRTRQIRGQNLVPIEFEIACELPDKYVRKDEVPAQESEPTTSGFNGEKLIQVPKPPDPAPASSVKPPAEPAAAGVQSAPPAPPPDPRKARVVSLEQDFARLALGMFAASFDSYPLTFAYVGQAEAPQGKADVIDAKGPGSFTVRLFINAETHLPIMVSWTSPATSVVLTDPGQPPPTNLAPGSIVASAPPRPPASAPKAEQDQYVKDVQELRKKTLAAAKPVESRLYFADYREVGSGVKFPFRLRKAVAGETTEETNFDAFKINPRIDPRKFEPAK